MGCGSSAHYNYSDFPTPSLLAELQRRYQKDSKPQEYAKDRDFPTVPAPFPPKTNKSEVFRAEECVRLDKRAQQVPLELACRDFNKLVAYLIEPAKNSIEKARTIFVWISSQRLQNIVDFMGDTLPPEESPLYMILRILVKQWGNGYSELFSRMCKSANIPCKIIQGKVKGNNYKIKEPIKGTNDYCLIYVEGCWRIIDQHWGSQYIVNKMNDPGSKTISKAEEEIEVHQIVDDFYFLTDPEAIVYTHLACESQNQLLARPVKEEEFVEMALLKDAFFEFGMTTVSHPKCHYKVKNGEITLEFGLPKKRFMFSYSLFKSLFDDKANEINGFGLEQFVLMEIHGTTLMLNFHLPKIGKYTFELYGKDEEHSRNYKVICEYLFDCLEPDLAFEPLPENSRSEWGMNCDTAAVGLEASNTTGGIITTKAGKACLVLQKTKAEKLVMDTRLINPQDRNEKLDHCVRHYTYDKMIFIHIKCPVQRDYILEIYCKSKAKNSFENVCNYVIRADQACHDLSFYPECENQQGQTGDLSNVEEKFVVKPLTHPHAIIDPMSDKKEMIIELDHSGELSNISSKMTRHFYKDKSSEDCSDYVYTYRSEKIKCFVNFPKIGFYKLVISSNGRGIYEYLINVTHPNVECSPYPQPSQHWKADYCIIAPKSYYLSTGQKVNFKAILPGLDNVHVEDDLGTKDSMIKTDGIWEKDIFISPEAHFLYLNHSTKSGQKYSLLRYKIVDENMRKQLKKDVETEDQTVHEFLTEIEKRKNEEDVNMEQRKLRYKERLTRARKEFAENKKQMEEEENALQMREIEYEKKAMSQVDQPLDSTTPQSFIVERTKKQNKDLKLIDGEDWRKYHPRLSTNLALEKLRDCVRRRDKQMLRSSIEECMDIGLESHGEVRNAAFKLKVLEARKNLEKACLEKDPTEISNRLDVIRSQKLYRHLQPECREAEYLMDSLSRQLSQGNILDLDKKTMTEIRRYTNPPPMFHQVIQATLLLLGEDEDLTDSWKECQRLCNPQGPSGMNRKILMFDVLKVHPEMVSRANQILEGTDLSKLRTACPSAACFYVWSKGVIDECTSLYDLNQYKPASRERQREILGRIEEPFKFRNNY